MLMTRTLLNHFPCWFQDLSEHPNDYMFIVSDDYDSYYTAKILSNQTKVDIGGYLDYKRGLFLTKEAIHAFREPVYVDVPCIQDGVKCFDNHKSLFLDRNHMAINANRELYTDERIMRKYYERKYCASTLLLVISLFFDEKTIASFTESRKMMLLSVDGFYLGFYNQGGKYRYINEHWLRRLGLYDLLIPTIETHTAKDFEQYIKDHHVGDKFYIDRTGYVRARKNNRLIDKKLRFTECVMTLNRTTLYTDNIVSHRRQHSQDTDAFDVLDVFDYNPYSDLFDGFCAAEIESGIHIASIIEDDRKLTELLCYRKSIA